MRRFLALSLLVLAPAVLDAAPLRPLQASPGSADSPPRLEYQQFVLQLHAAINQVSELYVRPVSRADLAYAALKGLYETARLPVPATLRADTVQADNESTLTLLFRKVIESIGDAEGLRGRNAVVIGCQAMARSLDPYTDVVLGVEQRRTMGLETESCGVGLEVGDVVGDAVPVEVVHAGGPAQRAGLRPGDEITYLDDRPVTKLKPAVVQKRLTKGPPGPEDLGAPTKPLEPVKLTCRRAGRTDDVRVVLDPVRFRIETVLGVGRDDDGVWDYWADAKRHIAHVRLAQLSTGTAEDLRDVVARLQRDGMTALVLDLRWCPGGYLTEAVDVARLFLSEGAIATVRMRSRPDVVHRGDGKQAILDLPLVVLVNGDTLGGAELIAAALQDRGRAVVVGQRTRGKASVQTPVHLGVPGTGMKLTSGTFLRPSGKNLHRFPDSRADDDWGVYPDVEFKITSDLESALKQWWQMQTLRPGRSMERLPLDEPKADPSQQAALDAAQNPGTTKNEMIELLKQASRELIELLSKSSLPKQISARFDYDAMLRHEWERRKPPTVRRNKDREKQ
jgi:carboxyl-terminal processing protease